MTVRAAVLALALLLALPAAAGAHAQLVSSAPARGATLDRAPGEVAFRFDEGVEASFGAVRVYDREGERVDDGDLRRPRGAGSKGIAVGLRDVGDGTYTATYRVVSADGHPISGGLVFTVGAPGPPPSASLDELLAASDAGPVTEAAFGVVRALGYLAIAVLAGGLLFVVAVWRPAPVPRRARRLLLAAALLGLATAVAGVVLQGATAGGTTAWAALDPGVVRDVLDTRTGEAWALRAAAFLVALPALRPAGGVAGVVLAAAVAALLVAPALGGHATAQEPAWLLAPLDVAHVAAMSAWAGGLVVLLLAVPAATRALEPAARTRLLATVLPRFSALALGAVAVLLATGAGQSLVHLTALGDLTGTGFGRALLAKAALLALLIAAGAWQRRRTVPRLRALAAAGEPPGAAGHALRTALRAEVALLVAALGVTAALVASPPPSATARGPVSVSEVAGPLRLELTVDPATVGANELHLYLFDRRTGAPFDATEELTLRLALPGKDVGPLDVRTRRAGPGHVLGDAVALPLRGDWRLTVRARVSAFDEHAAVLDLPVR